MKQHIDNRFAWWITIINVTLFIILGSAVIYVYFINTVQSIQIGSGVILALLAVGYIAWFFGRIPRKVLNSSIKKLIYITNDGEREREWHIDGAISLVIGKSTLTQEVDIDLTDTKYTQYIANQHSILNCVQGNWYIEDLDTLNGVGVKRKGESLCYRIESGKPYKVDIGDMIYMGKARMIMK